MAKRAIGITINHDSIDIVQIAKTSDSYTLEKSHTASLRRESDNPIEILMALYAQKEFDRKAPLSLALPASALTYRHIDQTIAEQRSEQPHADWLDEFPHDADTIITEGCAYQDLPEHQHSYLMAATDRNTIIQHTDPIRQSGFNLQRIDAPILALQTLAITNHPTLTSEPAILLFADHDHLDILIFQANEAITIRSLPWTNTPNDSPLNLSLIIMRELEMSWRMAFNETIPPSTPIITAGPIATDPALQQTIEDDLLATLIPLNTTDTPSIAQGLALRTLTHETGEGMNFQNSNTYSQTQNPTSLRKPLLTTAALIIAIAATALTSLLSQQHTLENDYTQLKTQIRENFKTALPHETNIVNEAAQLKTHLSSLQQTTDKLGLNNNRTPLDIIALINQQTPKTSGITINSINITDHQIIVNATAPNNQQLKTWQQTLKRTPTIREWAINEPRP